MPLITDWLMVIITSVYVIATIVICVANFKSVSASKKQLSEVSNQFIENKRIDNLPMINLTIVKASLPACCMEIDITENAEGKLLSTTKQINFENIGKGIAKNIKCTYSSNIVNKKRITEIPILPVHEIENINIIFCAKSGAFIGSDSITALFEMNYEDLFENKYLQRIEVEFLVEDEHSELFVKKIRVYAPDLLAKLL